MRAFWRLAAGVLMGVLASCGSPGATGSDGGGSGADAGSPPGNGQAYSKDVQVIVEPSDSGQALLDAINGATKSIHMTMYILSDSRVTSALIARKSAGVDVKVVLNQNFPSGTGNANTTAYNKLHGAGVPVVWANSSFTYTHEKCLIIDGQQAWVMTMNAAYSSSQQNREYLAVDRDPADVSEAEAIFQADFGHASTTPSGALLAAPTSAKPGIRALLATAQSSIDVEVEELSDTDVVMDLSAHSNQHQVVRVVLSDSTLTSAQQTAVNILRTHGVKLVKVSNPYIHAKAIVVDGARAYVGSANLTTTSLTSNRELGLVTDTAAVVTAVEHTINGDFESGTPL